MTSQARSAHPPQEHTFLETIQSLIVAFVLAMTFRGFVVEGFVIPTGSMAPTLLGEHVLLHSEATGSTYPVDHKTGSEDVRFFDQMVGPVSPLAQPPDQKYLRRRMGDRILIFKGLYPFRQPDRYDVVVFTNPTSPEGGDRNYIKRLVGLPNETLWLIDGDVYARDDSAQGGGGDEAFSIRRKPDQVQRAVWQPIFHSDFMPVRAGALLNFRGVPWQADADWSIDDRQFRCETAEPTALQWENDRRPLSDWNAYNMFMYPPNGLRQYHTSDLRIAASIIPESDGLSTVLELRARHHIFEFEIGGESATVRMRREDAPADEWSRRQAVEIAPLRAGRPTNVEFWHVDQRMSIHIDGRMVVELSYDDWTPPQRYEYSYGRTQEAVAAQLPNIDAAAAELSWHFEGSPLVMHRVRVDRDLYYQPTQVSADRSPSGSRDPGAATHPGSRITLGPDQFFMLGDNSPASLDSRSWGESADLVATQVDDTPFVVHRDLLLGKAWGVYFPAPHPLTEGGVSIVPDFGRMRFIR